MGERKAVETYLLAGVMFCGKCGEKMIGNRKKPAKDRPYRTVYRCSGRKKYKVCDQKEIDKEKVEGAVIDYMSNNLFNEEYIGSVVKNVHKAYEDKTNHEKSEYDLFSSKLEEVEKEEANLLDALSKIGYSEAIHNRLAEMAEKKETLKELIAETQKSLRLNVTEEMVKEFLMQGANIKTMEKEEQKAIIRRFVHRIDVFDDKIEISFLVDYFNEKTKDTLSDKKRCLPGWCGCPHSNADTKIDDFFWERKVTIDRDEIYKQEKAASV